VHDLLEDPLSQRRTERGERQAGHDEVSGGAVEMSSGVLRRVADDTKSPVSVLLGQELGQIGVPLESDQLPIRR
jgi:hypothetical protein